MRGEEEKITTHLFHAKARSLFLAAARRLGERGDLISRKAAKFFKAQSELAASLRLVHHFFLAELAANRRRSVRLYFTAKETLLRCGAAVKRTQGFYFSRRLGERGDLISRKAAKFFKAQSGLAASLRLVHHFFLAELAANRRRSVRLYFTAKETRCIAASLREIK